MNLIPMKMTVLSIDPSIRACGWALLINQQILTGVARSKKFSTAGAILEIYRFLETICPPNLNYLLIEKPTIADSWTKNRKESISKLLACYGMCLTLAQKDTILWTPTVPQWKGQQSKDVSNAISNKLILQNGLKVKFMDKIPESLLHNAKDAVAILTEHLKKKGIIKWERNYLG